MQSHNYLMAQYGFKAISGNIYTPNSQALAPINQPMNLAFNNNSNNFISGNVSHQIRERFIKLHLFALVLLICDKPLSARNFIYYYYVISSFSNAGKAVKRQTPRYGISRPISQAILRKYVSSVSLCLMHFPSTRSRCLLSIYSCSPTSLLPMDANITSKCVTHIDTWRGPGVPFVECSDIGRGFV